MHKPIQIGDLTVTPLQTRDQTGGCLELFEVTLPPHVGILFPHLHYNYDETILGVDGITTWTVAGKQTQVGPGEQLLIPRGAPHGFLNLHSQGARFLCIHTPGVLGLAYFDEIAKVMQETCPTDYAALGAIMTRYGIIPAHL